ncbi:MAG: HAMP domain-containing sensor histidine kinase, partial [Bacteroidota bacterium]
NELILAQALAYRASALEKLNRLSEALVVGEESISVAEHQEDIIAKVRSYLSVGRILLKANKLELAESYCRIVEDLIKKNTKSTLGIKSNTYDLLHQIMAKKGAYEEAYYYRGHYQSTMDSIRNETSIRKINTLTLQHEHEQALSEEQAKTQAAQYRLEQQRIQYSLLAVLLILAVVSLLLVYNLYNKKRKYSEELEMINSIIQQKGKQINDKNKKLDRFTYSISHDIISRLNNLVLLGTILANDEQPDSLQKFRGQAVERLTALMTYCRELLQWAKSETNGKALPTDLSEIMAAAIKEYSPRIQQYQTKVSTDFLPIVQLPRVVAENVFMNLVDNAVKYSKDAQPYPRVQITAKERPEQQQWVITIQDNGRGMTAAQQRQMFEITRDSKGLALVKKNLENHNGQIWLEQSSATGTSICVAVPAVQEEAE